MKNRKPWTTDEVNKLREMYNEGASHKAIARMLARSTLSINKALDRYGIRNPRPLNEGIKRTGKNRTDKKSINVRSKPDPFLVEISTIIINLKGRGFTVTSTKSSMYPYLLNDIPKTELQLLLECNRYRYNNKLPVYRLITNEEE